MTKIFLFLAALFGFLQFAGGALMFGYFLASLLFSSALLAFLIQITGLVIFVGAISFLGAHASQTNR
jgi:hypothetical protein